MIASNPASPPKAIVICLFWLEAHGIVTTIERLKQQPPRAAA
jgi:hypothetical protein